METRFFVSSPVWNAQILIGNPNISSFAMHEAALQCSPAARSTFNRGKKQSRCKYVAQASAEAKPPFPPCAGCLFLVGGWVESVCASSSVPRMLVHHPYGYIWLKIHRQIRTDRPLYSFRSSLLDVVHINSWYGHFMHLHFLCAA